MSCCSKKYIKLNPQIKEYLKGNISETQKNLYPLSINTLNTQEGLASFWGTYQFATEEKLLRALYIFYQEDKLPKTENILGCYLIILEKAIAQELLPELSKELKRDHQRVRTEIEKTKLSTEIELE